MQYIITWKQPNQLTYFMKQREGLLTQRLSELKKQLKHGETQIQTPDTDPPMTK